MHVCMRLTTDRVVGVWWRHVLYCPLSRAFASTETQHDSHGSVHQLVCDMELFRQIRKRNDA